MMRLTATAFAVVFLASPTFAEGLNPDMARDLPAVEIVRSADDTSYRNTGPALNSRDIAAIQYHEPVIVPNATRADVLAADPSVQ